MNQKTQKQIIHWLSVAAIGLALGFALQFVRAWTEPATAPPGGNLGAPINTGAATQTKTGGDICVDTNGDGINEGCVSGGGGGGGSVPDGTIVMWSGTLANIPSGWLLCNGHNGTPDLRRKFVYGVGSGENPGATGGATSADISGNRCVAYNGNCAYIAAGSQSISTVPPYYKLAFIMKTSGSICSGGPALVGGDHCVSECASAGGTLETSGSGQFCKFSRSACPSGWEQYQYWSTTNGNTCSGACSSCATGEHGFSSQSAETCTYEERYFGCAYTTGRTCYASITEIGCF